jgi:hypothetical protein
LDAIISCSLQAICFDTRLATPPEELKQIKEIHGTEPTPICKQRLDVEKTGESLRKR